jgi:GrpB-like predicted nucleotidyltransferase (UPF0157 family)
MQRSSSLHPRIAVVPYDPRWPREFERSSGEVVTALGPNRLVIHHIGSTSISGIHAKPVIDMLAVVADLAAVDQRSVAMERLGYEVMGDFGIAGRRYSLATTQRVIGHTRFTRSRRALRTCGGTWCSEISCAHIRRSPDNTVS